MWATLRKTREKYDKQYRDGASKWTDAALADRVLATLSEKIEPAITLDFDVAGAALTARKYWFEYHDKDKSRWPDWMARWCEHDLAFAVRALAECVTLRAEEADDGIRLARCDADDGLGRMGPEPFVLLREAVAKAKPEAYAAARAFAAELAPTARISLRLALAFVFPRESFAAGDRAWAFDIEDDETDSAAMLFYALAFAGDQKCMTNALAADSAWSGWVALSEEVDDVVKQLDENLSLALMRMMLLTSQWRETDVATALVTLSPNESVVSVAVQFLEDHDAGAVLRPFVSKVPEIAILALAERIAKVRATDARAKLLATSSALGSLTLAHRPIAEAAAKKATAAARTILESTLEDTRPLPDASPDDLPPSLAAPPWRATAKKKDEPPRARTFHVAMLAYEERVDWGDEDPKALAESAFPSRDKPRSKKHDALILKQLRATKKDDFAGIFETGELTDDAALTIIGELGPDVFYFDAEDIEGIVARHGLDALDQSLRYAAAKPATASGLARVDSPRVAELMAHFAIDLKKAKDVGEGWLSTFPEAAAVGLVPALGVKTGKEREAIEGAIRFVARQAPDVVTNVAKRYGKDAERAVSAVLASSSFAKVPKKLPKMPKFWNARGLPRPRIASGTKALSAEAMEDLGVYLALSKRDAYHPALLEIRSACDRPSLARFAWALFSEWLGSGASTKDDFGFFVLGVFGDDEAAHALQPMIKAWAPGGFPTRAQMGVDVLAALGTHAALEEVYKTATKVRSRALAAHAEKTLEKIAKRLRLSRDDLADRLVPDLDVDAKGTRTFDFGKRKFVVRFDEHLAPSIDALPKPNASDDEELAADAVAAFKEMKKRAREVFREQSRWLEQTLVTRRKYDAKTFAERFVDHPLLHMLGERLVWGVYADSRLRAPFRIDGTSFVDVDGRVFALDASDVIGMVHPIELDEKTRARWSTALAELRIIQPIVQLGRELHDRARLDEVIGAAKKKSDITTTRVLGLERRFWKRAESGQGGVVSRYEKLLGGSGELRAVLSLDPGVYLGDPKEHPEQSIEALTIVRGKQSATTRDLDDVSASELAGDIASLTSE